MLTPALRRVVDHPCIKHTSPEMTIRYARLTSPTLKAAYDQAAGKIARRIPIATVGRAATPDPGRVARLGDAQDPRRPRLLRTGPGGGGLRQHLRDLSQLRHRS